MITKEVVNGKQATVSHLTDTWEPCDPKDAALVKVVFDDGSGVLFGTAKKEARRAVPEGWHVYAADGTELRSM